MERAGGSRKLWKQPVKEDKIFYTRDHVLCLIEPPDVGSRGQYSFKRLSDLNRK